jgi:hypothetical protein
MTYDPNLICKKVANIRKNFEELSNLFSKKLTKVLEEEPKETEERTVDCE